MKFLFAFYLAAAVSASGDSHDSHDSHDNDNDHGHEEGHSCACEAEELNFTIDCTQAELLETTLSTLVINNCSTDCSSDICHTNFLIMQAHHDFCLHDEVPTSVEDSFHDFEGKCEECSITKKRDPNLDECPDAKCDNSGNEAYQVLLTNGCLTDCSVEICKDNYQILRSEHDNCDHDTLDVSAETGLHSYEDVCEAQNCNSLKTDAEVDAQLVCVEEIETMPVESAGVVSSQVSGFLAVAYGIALLAYN